MVHGYFLRLVSLARAQWPHPTSATRGGMRLSLSGLFFAGNLHRPWKAPPPSCWCRHVQHDLPDRLFPSPSAMLVAPFFLEIDAFPFAVGSPKRIETTFSKPYPRPE